MDRASPLQVDQNAHMPSVPAQTLRTAASSLSLKNTVNKISVSSGPCLLKMHLGEQPSYVGLRLDSYLAALDFLGDLY